MSRAPVLRSTIPLGAPRYLVSPSMSAIDTCLYPAGAAPRSCNARNAALRLRRTSPGALSDPMSRA